MRFHKSVTCTLFHITETWCREIFLEICSISATEWIIVQPVLLSDHDKKHRVIICIKIWKYIWMMKSLNVMKLTSIFRMTSNFGPRLFFLIIKQLEIMFFYHMPFFFWQVALPRHTSRVMLGNGLAIGMRQYTKTTVRDISQLLVLQDGDTEMNTSNHCNLLLYHKRNVDQDL